MINQRMGVEIDDLEIEEPGPIEKVDKAPKVREHVSPLRPLAAKAEKKLARALTGTLAALLLSVKKQIDKGLGHLNKADDPEEFDLDAFLTRLDLGVLEMSQEDFEEALSRVATDSGRASITQLGQSATGDLVEQVNERALAYAESRAAELVGLSDDLEFALTDSTRDMIRSTIAEGIESNLSTKAIGDALEEAYAFSAERAQTIAATEITSANSMGSLAGYHEVADLGAKVKKSWLVMETGCSVCSGNAAQGPIPLDDEFKSGDQAPGAHPHCRCVLVPEVEDDD